MIYGACPEAVFTNLPSTNGTGSTVGLAVGPVYLQIAVMDPIHAAPEETVFNPNYFQAVVREYLDERSSGEYFSGFWFLAPRPKGLKTGQPGLKRKLRLDDPA